MSSMFAILATGLPIGLGITILSLMTDPINDNEKKQPPLVPEDVPIPPRPEQKDEAEVSSETGGQKGPEPTRFGDWEKGGRCTDF